MIPLTSDPTPIAGGYRYSVTRGVNGSRSEWPVGTTLYRSPTAWNAGEALGAQADRVGRGYIDLTSTATIHNHLGPTIAVYNRTETDAWNSISAVVALGNLRSFVDYTGDTFGWAVGNDLTLTPSTGFKGMTGDAIGGLRLFNVTQKMYTGNTEFLRIDTVEGIDILTASASNYPNPTVNGVTWYSGSIGALQVAHIGASRDGVYGPGLWISAYSDGTFGGAVKTTATGTNGTRTEFQVAGSSGSFGGNIYGKIGFSGSFLIDVGAAQRIYLDTNVFVIGNPGNGSSIPATYTYFTKNYIGYANATHSEIANDLNSYKQLMLLGNTSAAGPRRVGVWDQLQVSGSPFYQTFNVNGGAYISGYLGIGATSPDGLQVGSAVSEVARGVTNVRLGIQGSPRVILEQAGYTQWQIDNSLGRFRIYIPGAEKLSLLTNGDMYIAGKLGTGGQIPFEMLDNRLGNLNAHSPAGDIYGTVSAPYTLQVYQDLYVGFGAAGKLTVNGTLGSPTWTAITYVGSWGGFGGTVGNLYVRKFGDLVLMRGLTKPNTTTPGQIVGTLPYGFRPAVQMIYNLYSSAGAIRVDIDTSGTITIVGTVFNFPANNYISFNGVIFFTT